MKLQVGLLTCGGCGKPRGLVHACSRKRRRRDRLRLTVKVVCPKCGKPGNPFTHHCSQPSDFRRRQAAHKRKLKAADRASKRRAQAEARKKRRREATARRNAAKRERRRKAAERKKAAAKARQQAARAASHNRERHEPANCTDEACPVYGCRMYRDGLLAGEIKGHTDGYAEGVADTLNRK